jgi:hypothetical protein
MGNMFRSCRSQKCCFYNEKNASFTEVAAWRALWVPARISLATQFLPQKILWPQERGWIREYAA